MLASPVAVLPDGPGWAFEFKWDGVRALLDVRGGAVTITSRAGNDVTASYPELADLAADADDALLDGEIVALDGGRPSFDRLATRMHVRAPDQARQLAARTPVTFIAFDLLRRFGVDLTGRPYVERRATLDRWLRERPAWTQSPYFDDGPATLAAAREHGLKGVVAKRLASPYRPGARGPDWVKLRFARSGEFVVLGWEAAAERPGELSSLLLGYHRADGSGDDDPDGGGLGYAGKVGSGLDARTAARLRRELGARAGCVLDPPPPTDTGRIAHWCEPGVVVEVQFAMWTADGRLRHPVFRRVRTDKDPREAIGDG